MYMQEHVNGIGVSVPGSVETDNLATAIPAPDPTNKTNPLSRFESNAVDSRAAITGKAPNVDFGRYRLGQGFDAGATQEILPPPQVRKPTRHNWFVAKSDPTFHFQTLIYESEDRNIYMVAPELEGEFKDEFSTRVLVPCLTRQGALFLWPVRLPDSSGRPSTWTDSALVALRAAMRGWIRMIADVAGEEYRIRHPKTTLEPPEWPDQTMEQMLAGAFRDRLIDSPEHPVLRALRGEV